MMENRNDVFVKSEAKTDPAHGCRPEERDIRTYIENGIVNIDKPPGPTSHEVTMWVRDMLGLSKAGHSGTLDPKVTGVQPTALGEATKLVKALLLSDKEYICLMALHDDVPDGKLENVFRYFTGPIYQLPPMKSAVKRELRIRNIYELQILKKEGRFVLFRVRCEAGTYIRTLCVDMGRMFGCGAHMHELRRTKAGCFDETTLVKLQDLKDAYQFYLEDGDEKGLRKIIHPVEIAACDLKKIWVKDSAVSAVANGADLNLPGISIVQKNIRKGDTIAIMSLKGELVATAKSLLDSKEIQDKNKGPAAKSIRVVMKPDVYPRKWKTHKKET